MILYIIKTITMIKMMMKMITKIKKMVTNQVKKRRLKNKNKHLILNLGALIIVEDVNWDVWSVNNYLRVDFVMMILRIIKKKIQTKIIKSIDMQSNKLNAWIVTMFNFLKKIAKTVKLSLLGTFVKYVIFLMMTLLKKVEYFTAKVVEYVE